MATVTSGFGPRPAPARGASTFHEGIDYRAPIGSPVYTNKPVTVTYAGQQRGYGNVVIAKDADGVEYRYGHLDSIPSNVKPGATIGANQQIATTGNTGVSSGAHLHYETRKDGKPFDPTKTIDPSTGKTYDNNASFSSTGGGLGNTTPQPDKNRAPGAATPKPAPDTSRKTMPPGLAKGPTPEKKKTAVNTILYINPVLRLGDE